MRSKYNMPSIDKHGFCESVSIKLCRIYTVYLLKFCVVGSQRILCCHIRREKTEDFLFFSLLFLQVLSGFKIT